MRNYITLAEPHAFWLISDTCFGRVLAKDQGILQLDIFLLILLTIIENTDESQDQDRVNTWRMQKGRQASC